MGKGLEKKKDNRMDTYLIKYEFLLADGHLKVFDIEINRKTIALIHSQAANKPEWTRLEHKFRLFSWARCLFSYSS